MTDREKFEAYFGPVSESMKIHGVEDFEIARRKDQQWQGWQAALASQQPADDGWIEWAGGDCPCPDAKKIEIRFPDGIESYCYCPKGLRWERIGETGDIIAYRVVKP